MKSVGKWQLMEWITFKERKKQREGERLFQANGNGREVEVIDSQVRNFIFTYILTILLSMASWVLGEGTMERFILLSGKMHEHQDILVTFFEPLTGTQGRNGCLHTQQVV